MFAYEVPSSITPQPSVCMRGSCQASVGCFQIFCKKYSCFFLILLIFKFNLRKTHKGMNILTENLLKGLDKEKKRLVEDDGVKVVFQNTV